MRTLVIVVGHTSISTTPQQHSTIILVVVVLILFVVVQTRVLNGASTITPNLLLAPASASQESVKATKLSQHIRRWRGPW